MDHDSTKPMSPSTLADTFPIYSDDSVAGASAPLTRENLAEFDRQQAHFWDDSARVSKMRQEQYVKVRDAAERIGVDLSMPVFWDMAQSFVGMTPMQRFAYGNDNS
jgi:hypothetical protein